MLPPQKADCLVARDLAQPAAQMLRPKRLRCAPQRDKHVGRQLLNVFCGSARAELIADHSRYISAVLPHGGLQRRRVAPLQPPQNGLVIRIHPSCRFVPLRRLTYIVAEKQNLLQRNTPQRLLRRLSAFIG